MQKASQIWTVVQDKQTADACLMWQCQAQHTPHSYLHFDLLLWKPWQNDKGESMHLGLRGCWDLNFLHTVTVHLTIEQLRKNLWPSPATCLLCFRAPHSSAFSNGSSSLSSWSCPTPSNIPISFAYLNNNWWLKTWKHNCSQENLPWLMALQEISRLHIFRLRSRDICDEMEGAPWQSEDGELTTRYYLPLSNSPHFLLRYLILQKQMISAAKRWYSGSNRVRFHPIILKQRSYFTTGVYCYHCAAFWTYSLL